MENERINKKILSLWNKFPEESGELFPLLLPELRKNSILFIGLNPSFSIGRINFLESCKKSNKLDPDLLIKMEKNVQEKYPYFSKFKIIAKKVGFSSWEHIDLFFYRLTSQKKFKKIIGFNEKKEFIFNNFGEEQLKLSLELIKEITPKVIVVVNSFSSDIINNHSLFKINTKQFNQIGYDFFEIEDGSIPILFSSMVTGQRALDKHSLRRLIFSIKKCLIKDKYKKE